MLKILINQPYDGNNDYDHKQTKYEKENIADKNFDELDGSMLGALLQQL